MPASRDRKKMSKSNEPSSPPAPADPEPPRFLPGTRPQDTAYIAHKKGGGGGRISPRQAARNVTATRGGKQRSVNRQAAPSVEMVVVAFRPHVDADTDLLAKTLESMKVDPMALARLCRHEPARFRLARSHLSALRRKTDLGVVLNFTAA